MNQANQIYKRPPITESVIEIRFIQEISKSKIEKSFSRLRAYLPSYERLDTHTFLFDDPLRQAAKHVSNFAGYKLMSKSGEEIIIIGKQHFIYSHLAPYPGWSTFKSQAEKFWELNHKAIGAVGISRVGLRYLNRIDVNLQRDPMLHVQHFLRIFVDYPEGELSPPRQMFSQIVMNDPEDDFQSILTVSTTASPVPHCIGLLLDVDVAKVSNLPSPGRPLWEMLDKMRIRKNALFETAITDKSRSLFNE